MSAQVGVSLATGATGAAGAFTDSVSWCVAPVNLKNQTVSQALKLASLQLEHSLLLVLYDLV